MKRKHRFYPAWFLMIMAGMLAGCGSAGKSTSVPYAVPTISETLVSGAVLPQSVFQNAPVAQKAAPATPTEQLPTATPTQVTPPTATPIPTDTPIPMPTSIPTAQPVDGACLVGKWQVTDLAGAVEHSYAQSQSNLDLQNLSGQTEYEFTQDGTMRIAFDHLTATFQGMVDQKQVTVVQSMDGSATAHYQVNAPSGQVLLSNFGGDGIQMSLTINGQQLVDGTLPVWQAFASGPSSNGIASNPDQVESAQTAVTCQGNTLTIQALSPVVGSVVNLQRAP